MMNSAQWKRPARLCLIALWGTCAVCTASAAEIGQDFRGVPYNPALFRTTGPNASGSIKPDNRGVRITLTAEHGLRPAVGLATHTGIKGDFEITMAFEIIQVDTPVGGNGAGVSIWIRMVSYSQEAATIWWAVGSDGEASFRSHRASTGEDGKRAHYFGEALPTKCTSGRLRLVRTGSMLSFRVAEGSSDAFSDVFDAEIGEDDLEIVRFAADNGGSATLVDALITDVKIKSDDEGVPDELPPRPSRWPLWIGIGLAGLCLGGGYWFWSRK